MTWRALVPLKAAGGRKTRLAGRLDAAARDRLGLAMFSHVVATLSAAGVAVTVVSPVRPIGWDGDWLADAGDDLNAALEQASAHLGPRKLVIVHADLPFLTVEDVRALLDTADRTGLALAPDRHGSGTNAVAISGGAPLRFCFGAGSMAGFVAQAGGRHRMICRDGLSRDLDTLDDLDAAIAEGCVSIR